VLEPRSVEYERQPHPVHFDLSTAGFDIRAQTPIGARDPIRKWMFFGGPNWIDPKDSTTTFRITFFDSRNSNGEQRIALHRATDPEASITGDALPLAPKSWVAPWDKSSH